MLKVGCPDHYIYLLSLQHYTDKEGLWAANKAGESGGTHHHGQHWELLAQPLDRRHVLFRLVCGI